MPDQGLQPDGVGNGKPGEHHVPREEMVGVAEALKDKPPLNQQRKSACFLSTDKVSNLGLHQSTARCMEEQDRNVIPRALLDWDRGQKGVIGSWTCDQERALPKQKTRGKTPGIESASGSTAQKGFSQRVCLPGKLAP